MKFYNFCIAQYVQEDLNSSTENIFYNVMNYC